MSEQHERSQPEPKYMMVTDQHSEDISEDASLKQRLSSESVFLEAMTFYLVLLFVGQKNYMASFGIDEQRFTQLFYC